MLAIKLGTIIEYGCHNEERLKAALTEFFNEAVISPNEDNFEEVTSLFNEWLIFEFNYGKGPTIITEYYLKNPDILTESMLQELKEIIETQQYGMFQIEKLKRGEWIELYNFKTGNVHRVYDVKGSLSTPNAGTLCCRIAKVAQKWIIVGGNPLSFPIHHTERSKKIFLDNKLPPLSPKDIYLNYFNQPPKAPYNSFKSKKDLQNIRKRIESTFNKLAKKYNLSATFKEIIDFVYKEQYKDHFADFNSDILKKFEIPEEVLFENVQFFHDLWNYFPHKILDNKSPAEKFKEHYG